MLNPIHSYIVDDGGDDDDDDDDDDNDSDHPHAIDRCYDNTSQELVLRVSVI